MKQGDEHSQDAPGQNKVFNITVNTRAKTWEEKKINYRQVVGLTEYEPDFDKYEFTIVYTKGDDKKPKGVLNDGGNSIPVKDGMEFDVEQALKS